MASKIKTFEYLVMEDGFQCRVCDKPFISPADEKEERKAWVCVVVERGHQGGR